jgi:hypothetical protein
MEYSKSEGLPFVKLMEVVIGIFAILFLVAIYLYLRDGTETFTIHKVIPEPCMAPICQVDDYLLPHSALFVVSGFNYQDNPKIYRDDKLIIPLKFARDYVDMLYFYTIESPLDICKHEWIVETSDFVEPVVINGRTAQTLSVTLLERASGKNKWSVKCP